MTTTFNDTYEIRSIIGKPIYLLIRQSAYKPDGTIAFECLNQYNAQGYILSMKKIEADGSTSTTTYEYTGEYTGWGAAKCMVIPDRQRYNTEEAWLAAQWEGTVIPWQPQTIIHMQRNRGNNGEEYSILADPLINKQDVRATILANGGVLTKEDFDNIGNWATEGWAYGVYTFDEADNPISIVTYNDAGVVTGTATFEWQLLDIS